MKKASHITQMDILKPNQTLPGRFLCLLWRKCVYYGGGMILSRFSAEYFRFIPFRHARKDEKGIQYYSKGYIETYNLTWTTSLIIIGEMTLLWERVDLV